MENEEASAERLTRRSVLIGAGLYVEDPESIEGLIFPIADGRHYGRLLREYDTQDTTGRKVRCASRSKHQFHYKGFAVELDDGNRALIGIDCGEKHFGKGTWAEMRANLKYAQDKAYYEARVAPALAKIETIAPLLRDLRRAVAVWGQFRRSIREGNPYLFEDLTAAASDFGGRLVLEQSVLVNHVDASGQHSQRRETQLEEYGRIPFPDAFLAALPEGRIAGAIALLTEVAKVLSEPSRQDLASRAFAFSRLRKARREIEDAQAEHHGWLQNLSLNLWEDVCRWRNASGDYGKYRLRGRRLLRTNQVSPYRWIFLNPPRPKLSSSRRSFPDGPTDRSA